MNGFARISRPILCLLVLSLSGGAGWAQYASHVVAYDSTGANPSFVNPVNALGPPSTNSTPSVPDNSGIVTIGPGGFLILAFDSPLRPDPTRSSGYDFIVFGNAFYVGGDVHVRYQKPALVEVGVDRNGNGYDASDPFYVLQGSPNPMSGYPFKGIDDRLVTTWGYANVTPTNGAGDPQTPTDPFASGIANGSAGGDAFRLSWAVDSLGRPVPLDHIDFVRIRTAGNWPCAIDAVSIVRSASYSVSGTVALDGAPGAVLLPISVELRAPGNIAPLQTHLLPTGGAFTLAGLAPGHYDLAFKGANTLRRVVSNADLTSGSLTGLSVILEPGDSDNNNTVDVLDFGALVNAYGTALADNNGYDPTADFNGDGRVDVLDFGLLVNNYGTQGDL